MATYVLLHGAWAGGWQWKAVSKTLRSAGHDVYTPTFTGLGERSHLATPDVDLNTHIQDVVNVFRFEDLHDVILVGYSYSGLIATGVADCIPERIAKLVYLDALVPQDGQSGADLFGAPVVGMIMEAANQYGGGWLLPHNPPDAPFRTPHPIKELAQPVTLRNPQALALPRTFIYCTADKDGTDPLLVPVTAAAQAAKADPHWRYYELNAGHDVWESDPQGVARILLELAA